MIFAVGLVLLLIGVVGYKFNKDVETIRKIKACDVLDPHYCMDCKLHKTCIEVRRCN